MGERISRLNHDDPLFICSFFIPSIVPLRDVVFVKRRTQMENGIEKTHGMEIRDRHRSRELLERRQTVEKEQKRARTLSPQP